MSTGIRLHRVSATMLLRIARRSPFALFSSRTFTVLALESSADDTCAAVVTSSREILSNVVLKQNHLHESYGGIHPTVAIEAHQRNMPLAVQRALGDANLDFVKDIDGVAFTRGPGIGGCLSVGSNAAKSLAAALGKPLVGVHHMQAHALTPLLTTWPNPPTFPFLTLLISGGHTLLLLANSPTSFKILATTSDESIGRSFDKVSRMLGLNWTVYGPGAALEQFSAEDDTPGEGSPDHFPPFPRPMPGRLAFSYASFHSHVERYIFARGGADKISTTTKRSLAKAFQEAAITHLLDKLSLGLEWCQKQDIEINAVVVSGGVASNCYLRNRFSTFSVPSNSCLTFVYPPPKLCTDNAVMIGWASLTRFLVGDHDDYTIDLRPKWSIENL